MAGAVIADVTEQVGTFIASEGIKGNGLIVPDSDSSTTITGLSDTGDLAFSGGSPSTFDSKEFKSLERLDRDTTSPTPTTTVSSIAPSGSLVDDSIRISTPDDQGSKFSKNFDKFENLKAIYTELEKLEEDSPVADVLDKLASGEIVDALSARGESLRDMAELNDVDGIIRLAKEGETFNEHVRTRYIELDKVMSSVEHLSTDSSGINQMLDSAGSRNDVTELVGDSESSEG